MEKIKTNKAPVPAGHYSQAIVHEGLVYVSGQLPIDPISGKKITASIGEQTEQVLKNLAAILEASDSRMDRVLKVTVYISDISLWEKVDEVYARIFGDHRPARAIVPTRELHFGFNIEIEATAAIRS